MMESEKLRTKLDSLRNQANNSYSHVSFFDLDHTLLTCNSSYCYGSYLSRNGLIPFANRISLIWKYALHKLGGVSIEAMHHISFDMLFHNHESQRFLQLAALFLDESFSKMVNQPVMQRLTSAKKNTHFTVLLSSSPHFLVQSFADRFEIDMCHGTKYVLDAGRWTTIEQIINGNTKSAIVKDVCAFLEIPLENTTGYSDSHLDLPFLETVGTAVAVNPTTRLKKISQKRNWEIISTT